jgi:hypothetical protein
MLVKKAPKNIIDLEIKAAKKILYKKLQGSKKGILLPDPRKFKYKLKSTGCIKNPNIEVHLIPYMGYDAADLLKTYGFETSDDFFRIDTIKEFEKILNGHTVPPIADKNSILNGLGIGYHYANGFICPAKTEVEKLMKAVPGLRLGAAKMIVEAFGSSHVALGLINIDPYWQGHTGMDYAYQLYDWAFQLIKVTPLDAPVLFEGLMYAVHYVNSTALSPGPGGSIPRNP